MIFKISNDVPTNEFLEITYTIYIIIFRTFWLIKQPKKSHNIEKFEGDQERTRMIIDFYDVNKTVILEKSQIFAQSIKIYKIHMTKQNTQTTKPVYQDDTR